MCMPTVLRFESIRIMIRTDDHMPPHVHAVGPGAEAKILIGSQAVYWSWGFSARAIREICAVIAANNDLLMEKWDEIHGEQEEES
jgi:hypothetical protein